MKLTATERKNYSLLMFAFANVGDGLRLGELVAITEIEEGKAWRLLRKLVKAGCLADEGDQGYRLKRAVAMAA